MRRNERERIARRNAYQGSQKVDSWMPRGFSLESYLSAIKSHEPMSELLDYLSKNHRTWTDTDFDYNESKNGVCEKCSVRALKIGSFGDTSMGDMKSSSDTGFDGEEVQYSKFIAERFADGKEPITLTPELHREFICQSWIERGHLDHIPEERMRDPGIAAIEAQPDPSDKLGLLISFRVIDGSHRAALTHREGRPFSAYILTPVENLKSIFAIGAKKNPFFALRYGPELEELLRLMARGELGPYVKS